MADSRPKINASILGDARYIEFFNNGKQVNNIRGKGEVFFSIKHRIPGPEGKWSYGLSKHGYIIVTPGMREIFNTLFQDNKKNMHIEFIEWYDSWNAVFCDGIYISQRMLRIEKDDFQKWESTIKEVG